MHKGEKKNLTNKNNYEQLQINMRNILTVYFLGCVIAFLIEDVEIQNTQATTTRLIMYNICKLEDFT